MTSANLASLPQIQDWRCLICHRRNIASRGLLIPGQGIICTSHGLDQYGRAQARKWAKCLELLQNDNNGRR